MKSTTGRPMLGLFGGLIACLVLCGCVGYSTWPPADNRLSLGDPNGPQMGPIMGAALGWAIEHNPSGDPRTPVINGPTGLRPHLYRKMADLAGAEPLTPANEDHPTYHVVRVLLRGSKGQVDLLAPNGPEAEAAYTPYTVWLRSAGGLWEVERYREWHPGTFEVPELYYMPGTEAGAQPTFRDRADDVPPQDIAPEPMGEPVPAEEPAPLPPGVYEVEPG